MPSFEFTSPDGKKYTVAGPDGSTKEQAFQMLQQQLGTPAVSAPAAKPERSMLSEIGQGIGNAAKGVASGFADVGNTILNTVKSAAEGAVPRESLSSLRVGAPAANTRNADRNASLEQFNEENKESTAFNLGRVGGNIAATLPVGGVLATGVRAVAPGATGLANALATGGFKAGTTPGVGNALTRVAGGAIAGGASAGLVDPEHALTGAVVGGALPGAAVLAGKAGGAIRKGLTGGGAKPEVAALAQRAKELGIDIPADRLVNSKPMNALAATLNYVPFSGRAATETGMESQLNRALSRTFGQDSDNVTGALRKANEVLGAKFDDVLKNNTVTVDDVLMTRLGDIESTAGRELGSDGMAAIKGQISELMDKGATGQIDGQAAYNIKRTLDRIGRRSTPEAFHAREMKSALMDALDRSIGPAKAAAFAETRKQYSNMLSLEKIAKNGAEGDISVARMANMKNINNPELQELADIAAQFVKTRESQHGAMQRAVVGLGAGTLAGIPTLAGGAVAGRGVNMALNSNAIRKAMLGAPMAMPASAEKALQGAYRVAPVATSR